MVTLYNFAIRSVVMAAAVRPEIHEISGVSLFERRLWANASFNRFGLKRFFVERFKGYRMICTFIKL
jgi:hypothetical protein